MEKITRSDPENDNTAEQTSEPTRTWQCQKCGRTVERYRGMDDVQCDCGAWYNSFGQRLRDDWMDNMSNWDENISDLDGFEESQLRKEL